MNRLDNNSVLAALVDDFDYVAYVLPDENIVQCFKIGERLSKYLPGDERLEKSIAEIFSGLIYSPERDSFIGNIDSEKIFSVLEKEPSYKLSAKFVLNNIPEPFRFKFVKAPDNERAYICGVAKIGQKEREDKELDASFYQRAILNGAYSYFKVNLTTNIIIPPIIEAEGGEPKDYSDKYGPTLPPYDKVIKVSAERYVDTSYKESFVAELSSANQINRFERGSSMTEYTCRIYSTIIGWHYRKYVCYMTRDDSTGDILSMVVAYNVTDEYTAKKAQEDNIDRIMKLSDNFEALYEVDLSNGHYITYTKNNSYADNMVDKFRYNDDYFGDIMVNVRANIHPDDVQMVIRNNSLETFLRKLHTETSFTYEYRLMYGDEAVWYRAKVIRYSPEQADKVIVGVFNVDAEVRQRNQQQKELEEAKKQAEAANEAKSAFLFNMSHDIRTPMNAIVGFTDRARKNITNRDVLEDSLDKVEMSNEYLLRLINDVLDMARIESGKMVMEEVASSIPDRAVELVEMLRSDIDSKNLTLKEDFGSIQNKFVWMDPLRVRQILMNLLSNSIKYTKPGGTISFEIKQIASERDGYGTYLFVIKDTGIGMSKEFLTHLFEQFSREKTATASGQTGTGLGMAIVKRLVDMMGGTIDVDSNIGIGTTVNLKISFKLATEDANPMVEEDASEDIVLSNLRVLLVEDNELNRELAEEILTEHGMLVDTAEDGSIAVEKITKAKPGDYDIVLMDVQMPYMDGYEATKAIRAMDSPYSRIPIIAMTANAFDEDRRKAFENGMNDHIAKPIDVSKLLESIRMLSKKN